MKTIPITVEMPMVTGCEVSQCGYNTNDACHAKAITIGDSQKATCGTYLSAASHVKSVERKAGVGACKMSDCTHNDDYECAAPEILVSMGANSAKCMTYMPN